MATKKKTSTKKKASSKKASTKKKAASKKKSPAKKKAASKKKSPAKKKAASKKKSPATKIKPVPPVKPDVATGPDPQVKPAPKEGVPAPDFTLPADDGTTIGLSELKGKKVVLYFYPRDNTPGCTIEAVGFRDHAQDFKDRNAVVLGVSRDSIRTHAGFKSKQGLDFPLLSDPDAQVIAAYGSWGEKKFMGRTFMGILRTTVLIDEEGTVRKVFQKVSPKEHAREVLDALDAMG